MTDTSPRLGLPLLSAGQAQKEIFHNEALLLLDALVQPVAVAIGADHPPESPAAGEVWILGDSPDEAWSGHPRHLAIWTEGGWRMIPPREGMRLHVASTGRSATYRAGGWRDGIEDVAEVHAGGTKILGAQQPSIASPTGGTTVDSEARAALNALLTALRDHGLIAS